MAPTLVTHAEKVAYLVDYLKSASTRPVMIVGTGGSGKSNTVKEASTVVPVNICIYYSKDGMTYIHSPESNVLKTVIESLGTNEDYTFAGYLGATIVQFAKDPSFE
jgi:ABC-type dipeptide/oligopeptide/nickel transport system ATPase component